MALLIIIVLVTLAVSFTCSILEATLLSSRQVVLTARKDQGDKGAARLLGLKEHRIDDSISAILTYNTIAHTVGATLAGAQAARVFGDNWVGVFSAILTILILLITEIIPKTIGTVYAHSLAGPVSLLISLMIRPPMKWVLYITRAITGLFTPDKKTKTTRGDVLAILKMAKRDGILPTRESKIMENLLRFGEITVEDVMTPRTVLVMFEENMTLTEALEIPEVNTFSRFPVYKETRDQVTGYVMIRDLLSTLREKPDAGLLVSSLKRPISFVYESLPVGKALQESTAKGEHLAIVLDEHGGTSGLVTMEDLVETALGVEIMDESDQVADMRKKAQEMRDARLQQMRRENDVKKLFLDSESSDD